MVIISFGMASRERVERYPVEAVMVGLLERALGSAERRASYGEAALEASDELLYPEAKIYLVMVSKSLR